MGKSEVCIGNLLQSTFPLKSKEAPCGFGLWTFFFPWCNFVVWFFFLMRCRDHLCLPWKETEGSVLVFTAAELGFLSDKTFQADFYQSFSDFSLSEQLGKSMRGRKGCMRSSVPGVWLHGMGRRVRHSSEWILCLPVEGRTNFGCCVGVSEQQLWVRGLLRTAPGVCHSLRGIPCSAEGQNGSCWSCLSLILTNIQLDLNPTDFSAAL